MLLQKLYALTEALLARTLGLIPVLGCYRITVGEEACMGEERSDEFMDAVGFATCNNYVY